MLGREVEVAPPVRGLGLPQDEVAVLGALGVAVEALTSPPQPGAADARLRPEAVVLVEPDGALSGPPVLAALVERQERGLAVLDALVHATQPPRRLGEQVEASGLGTAIAVRTRDLRRGVVRPLPVVASERVASRRERVGDAPLLVRPRGDHRVRRYRHVAQTTHARRLGIGRVCRCGGALGRVTITT